MAEKKKTRLQMLEEKRNKATLALRVERRKEANQRRKDRDTCLFTVGGAFIAMLQSDDEKTSEAAQKIWDGFISHRPPGFLDDRRRQLLDQHFGLKFQEQESRPPSAD